MKSIKIKFLDWYRCRKFLSTVRIKNNSSQSILRIESNVIVKGNVSFYANVSINRNVLIAASENSPITFGDDILIGPNCVFRSSNHGMEMQGTSMIRQAKILKEIVVGDNVWFGAGCIVLAGAEIGSNCVFAAGSIVTDKKYEDGVVYGGNPAKPIRRIG